MNKKAQTEYPDWIDPAVVGKETDPVEFPLERGKIREFAKAIKEDDPVFSEIEAARNAGFGNIPIPITYPQVLKHFAEKKHEIKYPFSNEKLLHGEYAVEYHRHPVAGETLWVSSCIVDAFEKGGKRGGKMKFVIVEQRFRDEQKKDVLTVRNTVLEIE